MKKESIQKKFDEIFDNMKNTAKSIKSYSFNTFEYNIKKVALLSLLAFLSFGFKPLIIKNDGGPTGFDEKWFNGTTGKLYEDKTETKQLKTFNIIANATGEIDDLKTGNNIYRGFNYWIVELDGNYYLLVVSPVDYSEKFDDDEKSINEKVGTGLVQSVYHIHVK